MAQWQATTLAQLREASIQPLSCLVLLKTNLPLLYEAVERIQALHVCGRGLCFVRDIRACLLCRFRCGSDSKSGLSFVQNTTMSSPRLFFQCSLTQKGQRRTKWMACEQRQPNTKIDHRMQEGSTTLQKELSSKGAAKDKKANHETEEERQRKPSNEEDKNTRENKEAWPKPKHDPNLPNSRGGKQKEQAEKTNPSGF